MSATSARPLTLLFKTLSLAVARMESNDECFAARRVARRESEVAFAPLKHLIG
jgi:hypothetical protein